MKLFIITCLNFFVLSISLNAQVVQTKNTVNQNGASMSATQSMDGAYLMTMQKARQNNKDSAMNGTQLKIYSHGYYMYAHTLDIDTLGAYGVGTYSMQNGKFTEHSFYTSANGAHNDSYDLKISKTADGYTQVINFPADASGPEFMLTESYKNMNKNMTSTLDGAWKMTKLTVVAADGTPTVTNDPLQYKFYQSGHFMYGNTRTDPATQKTTAGIGYGTFVVSSNGEVTENTINSSYRPAINTPVKLKVSFKGKDAYQQTIVWQDGSKMIEEYERLK
ncbi:MAG: hypothetical protein ACXVBH_13740 [Flavisolibacter sp.]